MSALHDYSKLNALIVDDFDSFRLTMTKMLQDFGIDKVDVAINGNEALKFCRHKTYDLVLCDYNLGKGKNGQQVLEELRYRKLLGSGSLFIMVSAESSKSIVMAAYDFEPDAYMAKPVTPMALYQRLRRLLAEQPLIGGIKRATEGGQTDVAIALCQKEIRGGGRHAARCQKMLAELFLSQGQTEEAEAVYRQVLDNRVLDWAQVGMAAVKKAQGDLVGAQQWLDEVIQTNPLAMRAYDLLSEIFREQEDWEGLQRTLEQAVSVSPLAIQRQQLLGSVAMHNNDLEVAATALRRAVRQGEFSCYDNVEFHLQFGRAVAGLGRTDKNLAKPFAREASKAINALEQRFGKSPERHMQAHLIESQLAVVQGDKQRAKQLLGAMKESFTEDDTLLYGNTDVALEYTGACRMLGDEKEASRMLKHLLEFHRENESELEKIDRLLEEPVSAKNRQLVASINRRGIGYYEAKNYTAARECFESALRTFPNHQGLRLNLIQTLLGKLENQSHDERDYERVQTALAEVEAAVSPAHEQFQRYRQLHERFRRYQQQHQQTNKA
ncbi:tetratricopeptide repeat-containing response regulator [Marinimicrobium alkaliphilum]|uniref:tetratricopeptide repeat-containing response regulator n=1 Tax=Marinimicrobium alkaliphilum TaxID=2202654 RepID=UPI000DBA83E9|nr:tetratricopeptide repeat-containing response regulator [Marinimicrobium alkaliphilum]